jgi:hypothetical protein
MASKMKTDRVLNFASTLSLEGDMFFTSGSVEKDYKIITETIKAQGYWAGNRVRYYFDEDMVLLKTEERVFGDK